MPGPLKRVLYRSSFLTSSSLFTTRIGNLMNTITYSCNPKNPDWFLATLTSRLQFSRSPTISNRPPILFRSPSLIFLISKRASSIRSRFLNAPQLFLGSSLNISESSSSSNFNHKVNISLRFLSISFPRNLGRIFFLEFCSQK